jgi:nucleoid-associated protein YgaU
LEHEIERLGSLLAEHERRSASDADALAAARSERDELARSLDHATEELVAAAAERDAARRRTRELEASLDAMATRTRGLEDAIIDVTVARDDLRLTLAERDERVRSLEREAAADRSEFAAVEAQLAQATAALEEAAGQEAEFGARLEAAEERNRSLTEALEAAQRQSLDLATRLEAEREQREGLTAAVEEAEAQSQEVAAVLEEAEGQRRDLAAALEAAEAQSQELVAALEEAEERGREAASRLEEGVADQAALAAELDRLHDELRLSREHLAVLQTERLTSAEPGIAAPGDLTEARERAAALTRDLARLVGQGGGPRELGAAERTEFAAKRLELERVQSHVANLTRARGTYAVQPGDSLSWIADFVYGDVRRWEAVFAANETLIEDPDRLFAGMVLVLPE